MTDRIIDLSEGPARLNVRHAQVVIEREGESTTVPLAEIAIIIVSHPAVSYTHAVLTGLCAAGGAFVVCDTKCLPTGMLLPLEGHFVQAERFAAQAQASLPVKKQLWKQIVQAKVLAQGRLLKNLRGHDKGLFALARKVRSGDTGNLEAHASRRYWPSLFGRDFRRDPQAEDQNRFLNYGYAVLRAAAARSLCAAGLHPSLGIHHHNRYDAFCLAEDLMEPFRPLVDETVVGIVEEKGPSAALDREVKGALIGAVTSRRFKIDGESRTLFDAMTRTASSLSAVFQGKRGKLLLPEI